MTDPNLQINGICFGEGMFKAKGCLVMMFNSEGRLVKNKTIPWDAILTGCM